MPTGDIYWHRIAVLDSHKHMAVCECENWAALQAEIRWQISLN